MAKIAKLVTLTLITRVVVEDNLTEEQEMIEIAEQSKSIFVHKVMNEFEENIEDIKIDTEIPFDEAIELTPKELNKLRNGKF